MPARRTSERSSPQRAGSNPPAPATAPQQRADAWSAYWARGPLHSCVGSFDGNYGGAIRAFWQEVFTALPPQARVLDVCCGNAPLGKLLVEASPPLSVDTAAAPGGYQRIDAVDMAQVAPAWLQELAPEVRARIHVHPRTDAAALPFEQDSFDLAMSQYGLEYAGAPAVAELLRVLRPGARLAAVMHHHEALPVRIAREELEHIAWLQEPGGVVELAAQMVEPFARSADPLQKQALQNDAAANALRTRLNASLQALEQRLAAARWPDVLDEVRHATLRALQRAQAEGQAAGEQAMQALRTDLAQMQLRQRELVEVALDEAAAHALLQPLGAVQLKVLRFDSGEIAGWAADVRRD